MVNEARFQIGDRDYDEPTNSNDVEEWFSGGVTLKANRPTAKAMGPGNAFGTRIAESGPVFHLERKANRDTANIPIHLNR